MQLRYFCRLVLPLLALAVASCAPSYLLSVKPARQNTLFASGETHAQAVADSVSLDLKFLGYEPDWLIFNAEYHNDSNRPVEVMPTAFQYLPLREAAALPPGQPVRKGELVPAATVAAAQHLPLPELPAAPLIALNPEPRISQLQAGAATEAARASRTDWFGIALFVAAVGTDIASASRRSETLSQAQGRATVHAIADAYNAISTANRIHHAATAETLGQQAELLSDYALRPVTLLPGQQVRGYVYLPRFDAADGLRLLAPVGKAQVPLNFVQTHQRQ